MKLNPVGLLCLTGLLSVTGSVLRTVPHKYHLHMTAMTWYDAQRYCRSEYTDLASILSDADWIRFKRATTSQVLYSILWIGLYIDIYDWHWTFNQTPLKNVTYSNWYPGQPDNYYKGETCGILSTYNYWFDLQCHHLKPFICYNANFTNAAKFVRVASYVTWPVARAYCKTHYTDLASAFNASDHQILVQMRALQGDSWIGLYRGPDTWKWSDGTIASNISWASGQPSNYYGKENCGLLYLGYFHDEPCAVQRYFYCQIDYPKRSQVMRLKLKSDASVFNPAVQSVILQQIIRKLEENGLVKENVKVAWRVHPDGNVVQKMNKKDL